MVFEEDLLQVLRAGKPCNRRAHSRVFSIFVCSLDAADGPIGGCLSKPPRWLGYVSRHTAAYRKEVWQLFAMQQKKFWPTHYIY